MDRTYFDAVIGHESIKEQLLRFISSGRLPHAMVFAGPEGLGKLPMAQAVASTLIGRPLFPGLSDLVCDEAHPFYQDRDEAYYLDLIGTMLRVSQFRQLQEKLILHAEGNRICLINHGETMNKEFANCMLKTLEEPPAGVHFILITNQPDLLLPTIVSRCAMVTFGAVSDGEMRDGLIRTRGGTAADYEQAVLWGGGNVARVLELLAGQGLENARRALEFLQVMSRHACPYAKGMTLTASLTEADAADIYRWLSMLLRDLVVLRRGVPAAQLRLQQYGEELTALLPYWPDAGIFSLLQVLDEAGEALRRHVNGRLVWDYVCIRFIKERGGH
ncbi:ATP-binding protein [Megasphaera hominis]|uniref:DNA polymerase III subunit delta' n=1 Tax=Megasphaera hominis TaxID=159836 RepID=A0ABR6VIU0_9FIRM|nr:DNA polymerase III subunit delta' C-terminal domain-containing protein [Megasphaera hominis]MBC3537207.1 AAA family ATPase [Megasphaera hominis]